MTTTKTAETVASPGSGETRVVTAGRDPASYYGFVNPPVYHASTVLYPTPRILSPTAHAISMAAAARRPRSARARLQSCEAARNARAWRCCRRAWRRFRRVPVGREGRRPSARHRQRLRGRRAISASSVLSALGVTTTYYDPLDRRLDRRLVPPEHAPFIRNRRARSASRCRTCCGHRQVAHAKGALVLMDNTWASPLYFRPLEHGVDLADPGRHQIYRRPFRRHARHRFGQRASHRRLEMNRALSRRSRPTTFSACAACARSRCGC